MFRSVMLSIRLQGGLWVAEWAQPGTLRKLGKFLYTLWVYGLSGDL